MTPLLTLAEACDRLRLSDKTLRKLIVQGDIRAAKVGRAWRMTEQSLEDYLERQADKASA